MTAATLTHLPLAAGGAMLSSAGRVAIWAFSHYMRAPLTHTGLLLLVGMSALAASNALYLQQAMHPAPLFAPESSALASSTPQMAPVVPAARTARPQIVAPLQQVETTGSVVPEPEAVIGNAEVFELQRKLAMMNLFDGKIDGYYGPQTAGAIRKFEERAGLPATGELTPEILAAVREAKPFAAAPRAEAPAASPLAAPVLAAPAAASSAAAPAATQELSPLPAPAPLPATVQQLVTEPAARQAAPVLRRELPETPQEAFNIAVDTAGDAIDTIIEGVQTVTMNRPPSRPVAPQRIVAEPAAQALPSLQGSASQIREPTAQVATANIDQPAPTAVLHDPAGEAAPAELPELDTDAKPEDLMPPFSVTDPAIVASVQRGLASLGFLHGPVDGVAGEATAKAIRNFEVYFNYKVTGRISPELLDLLVRNGASI
ncbi:MAG TPA: peptidoglycan-binding domain-containing protein [Devosiaceae bacterium]|jgi:peptidoglycan hydrolase-like protein with peptidoglycan-binding domain|nr:peptidoglycan-binding domain-containing protein [Devosiaceae bacterium]